MKRFIKLSFVLLAMLGVLFTSCKKEYENPPIEPLPEGEVITIGDILAMSPNTTFNGMSVCGIVTADEQSGNLYKQIFIQDAATGKAIELMLNTSSAARIGDLVRVYLDSTIMFNMYHNLPQLVNSTDGKGFNPDKHLYIYPHNDTVLPIEPKVVTIADIKTGQYTAALVKLENVEFVEQNAAFCDLGSTTNRTLKDATGEVIVRTSNYANFAYDLLPAGQGSLVAIASVYNNDWQLIIRSKNEMDFAGGTPNPPAPSGELQSMPYSQSFATEFGTYTTYDVEGPQNWILDYSCAVMKGYDGTNYVNEDWLISSPVAVVDVDHAKVAVNYVAQYQNSNPNDVTLQVSTDYVWGGNPTEANWTQMETTYPNTGGWSDFQTVETSLDEFIGQNITVAIKFTSSETQSRTFEVKSITVQEGEAGGGVTPPTPGVGEGSGTADDPYNVAAGITIQDQSTAWVHGYIVGAVKEGQEHNSVTSNDDIDWVAPFGRATNVLIADDASCNEIANCLIVKMPSGSAMRAQVNLKDNPDNLGKHLAVSGTMKNGFGKPGVDSPGTDSDFVLEGGEIPPTPPTPGNAIFSETFANGQGDFVIQDVVLPSELTYVWLHDSGRKHMKASAFKSVAYEAESWLVSPGIDLAGVGMATLSFDHAVNYAAPDGLSVMISVDYQDNVTTANWTELEMSAWPAGNDWTFITATADLTPFVGQTVTIAFKYTSTSSASATWEVKNIVIE